jgi:hypothetical protein
MNIVIGGGRPTRQGIGTGKVPSSGMQVAQLESLKNES